MSRSIVFVLCLAIMTGKAHGQEIHITPEGAAGPLAGSIAGDLTGGQAPVLIIPGSGPTDRDGNNPMGVKASTYRLLAQALAAHDVPSVRIDKRGMFGSAAAGDPNAVSVAAYVADIAAWREAINQRSGNDCVWLLGHSEGGLMALAAAADAPDSYCGLVLVAAPGRPLGDILREQLRANPMNASILPQAEAAIAALEQGKRVDTANLNPALMPLFAPQVQDFLISMFAVDPAQLAQAQSRPLLIVHGSEDLQVTGADAARLALARPDARIVTFDGVNHVLKQVPAADRAANIASYGDPDLPLASEVSDAIAQFVARQR